MNVGGILKSGVTKFATGTKTVAKSLASKATKTASKPEMLTKASEALSAQGKALIKKTNLADVAKNANKIEKTVYENCAKNSKMEELVRESIKNGLTPKEAVNGAKALISATGKESGKHAIASAGVFSEGLTQTEKKMQLLEKYGEKLKAQQAQKALESAMEEARKLY